MRTPLLAAVVAAVAGAALLLNPPNAKPVARNSVIPSPALLGTWKGQDIAKVTVSPADRCRICGHGLSGAGYVRVHVWGRCEPTFCDWGSVDARLAAASDDSMAGIAFRGTFDFNFQINELSAHLRGTTLVVDTFTRFTDGSGRTDFWEEEGMRR